MCDVISIETDCDNPAKVKQLEKYAKRMAFSKLAASKSGGVDGVECCGVLHASKRELHLHLSVHHHKEVESLAQQLMKTGHPDAKWKLLRRNSQKDPSLKITESENKLPESFNETDEYPWLPMCNPVEESSPGTVLLFYKYRDIEDTQHLSSWQKELCERLHLSGKVRVGVEGINATVAGSNQATDTYIQAVLNHPLFSDMTTDDFKRSAGGSEVFPGGLVVGIHQEIVPMGVSPTDISYKSTGEHLTPAEFHQALESHLTEAGHSNKLFIDCRNFYESKIGKFDGAIAPDLRKFSYWPEYVEKNAEMFHKKQVYMYCTGGIRCERGSAIIKQKTSCSDVYQLEGGIHKYIENFPEGHFRGKLFVFDDRYSIKANDDILSRCAYCTAAWDTYQPCTSPHCHQLVLSCDLCRDLGRTACCVECQNNADHGLVREQCKCTKQRKRIPIEDTQVTTEPGDDAAAVT